MTALEIPQIHAAYRAGTLTPAALATELLARIDAWPDQAIFISRFSEAEILAQIEALGAMDARPLYGIPCAVKDNIDVLGLPTTAACPDFAYAPAQDSAAAARLRAAGAIILGKTNLDQFATGLNGTRSPYGAPRCVFNDAYISGGSSSGSAAATAAGLCVFALGTDTAGSGRVPAAFNNLVGLKPSIGRIPATGLVPACQSLDCISVFAHAVADSLTVLHALEGFDPADPYARPPRNVVLPETPRAGILRPADRDFCGDADAAQLYAQALEHAATLGWDLIEIDYAPFREVAAMLYGSAFAAERLCACRHIFETSPGSLHPVIHEILAGATKFSAADAFDAIHTLQSVRGTCAAELAKADFLLLPTAPTIFTVAAMLTAPITANAKLGLYTNFVNFLDLAAIAIPAGFTPDGLPFGVTLIAPAFTEASLAAHGDMLHKSLGAGAGHSRLHATSEVPHPEVETTLVVAGAHLSGMVLNHELLALNARLLRATRTAPGYKLYALNTTPPKPGLTHTPGFSGQGIEVEVWSLTFEALGKFLSALPTPMALGRVALEDGTAHPGFLCEAHALAGAEDITPYGGWRAYKNKGSLF